MSFSEFTSNSHDQKKKEKNLSHNLIGCIFTSRQISEDIDPSSKSETSKLALAHLLTLSSNEISTFYFILNFLFVVKIIMPISVIYLNQSPMFV